MRFEPLALQSHLIPVIYFYQKSNTRFIRFECLSGNFLAMPSETEIDRHSKKYYISPPPTPNEHTLTHGIWLLMELRWKVYKFFNKTYSNTHENIAFPSIPIHVAVTFVTPHGHQPALSPLPNSNRKSGCVLIWIFFTYPWLHKITQSVPLKEFFCFSHLSQ